MASWFIVVLACAVGIALFRVLQALSLRANYPSEVPAAVEIPSDFDDWDKEFEEHTGSLPEFSRLNMHSYYDPKIKIRMGIATTGCYMSGNVIYGGKSSLSPFDAEDRRRAAERYPDIAING